MKEVSPEERERLKSVLHVNDTDLDGWLASQDEQNQNVPAFDLSEEELALIAKEKEFMRACWFAADAVMQMPTNHPAMRIDAIWKIHSNLTVALYNGVIAKRSLMV